MTTARTVDQEGRGHPRGGRLEKRETGVSRPRSELFPSRARESESSLFSSSRLDTERSSGVRPRRSHTHIRPFLSSTPLSDRAQTHTLTPIACISTRPPPKLRQVTTDDLTRHICILAGGAMEGRGLPSGTSENTREVGSRLCAVLACCRSHTASRVILCSPSIRRCNRRTWWR